MMIDPIRVSEEMKMKKSILAVCVGNSCRSQMTEAYLRHFGEDLFSHIDSAGLEPGTLNPYAVRAMAEEGIDISHKGTKSVFDLHEQGMSYSYVITVCDPMAAERCPIFPHILKKILWPFDDPAGYEGTDEEKMAHFREVRDKIKARVKDFVEGYRSDPVRTIKEA